VPYASALPAFAASQTGLTSIGVSGTDRQSGSDNTSYSFQTYAQFNGIDWSETGNKTASGDGGTTDTLSASANGLTFTALKLASATMPGSVSLNGASTTSFSSTEHAFLDDNGTWQNSGGTGSLTSSGARNWSLSGGGNYNTTLYGNAASGTLSTSGKGSDSFSYSQNFSYSPGGQWQVVGGSGGASGSGSITSGFSASGAYSSPDPNWSQNDAAGTAYITLNLGSPWSGSVSGSARATASYRYSTTSVFSAAAGGGWTTTGSTSATNSGSANSAFSGSLNFASNESDDTGVAVSSASLSGTAATSGSDSSGYSFTETETRGANGWSQPSGTGWASGNTSANFSYADSGNDTYTQSDPNGTAVVSGSVTGTVGESGSETYSLGYNTTAALASGATDWVQTGTGSGSANSAYSYSYTGGGGGSVQEQVYGGYPPGTTWDITNEKGSGSGTYTFSDPLNLSGIGWTGSASNTADTSAEDHYHYQRNTPFVAGTSSSTTIVDDEFTTTSGVGSPTKTFSGSGTATDTNYDSSGNVSSWQSATWLPDTGGATTTATYTNSDGPGSSSTASEIPTLWASYGKPGPEPGWAVPDALYQEGLVTSGGINLPTGTGGTKPTQATVSTSDFVFGVATPPSSAQSLVSSNTQVASLAALAPSPALVTAVWGMAFTGQAGEVPVKAGGIWSTVYPAGTPPQTPFAVGNVSAATSFTSEKIRGAGAVFGPVATAPAFPVTVSSIVVGYGLRGVSAGVGAPLNTVVVAEVCFAARTPVLMADWTFKPIEDVVEGDMVMAVSDTDPEGPLVASPVMKVYHNPPSPLLELVMVRAGLVGADTFARRSVARAEGEIGFGAAAPVMQAPTDETKNVIRVTANHRFYVRGRGWVAASDLREGDCFRGAGGEDVEFVGGREMDRVQKVYNMHVSACRTYFVATPDRESCILVHNFYRDPLPQAPSVTETPVLPGGSQASRAYSAGSLAVLAAQLFMGSPGHVSQEKVSKGIRMAQLAVDVANGDLTDAQARELARKYQINAQKTQPTPTLIRYYRNSNGAWHVQGIAPVLAPAASDTWINLYKEAKALHLREIQKNAEADRRAREIAIQRSTARAGTDVPGERMIGILGWKPFEDSPGLWRRVRLPAPVPQPRPQPQPSGPGRGGPPSTATAAPGKDDKDHNHHRLPQQYKEFFLKRFSEEEYEKLTRPLPESQHIAKPDGIHPRGYNPDWDVWIKSHPDATRQDILDFLREIEKQYGLPPID
jgi:hypothetical protein